MHQLRPTRPLRGSMAAEVASVIYLEDHAVSPGPNVLGERRMGPHDSTALTTGGQTAARPIQSFDT